MSAPVILEGSGLAMRFGGLVAIAQVDFTLRKGEILGIIGPDGAGKTTTFCAISALPPLAKGRIEIMARNLSTLRSEALRVLGMGFVPEGRRLFAEISVHDNIRLGPEAQGRRSGFAHRIEEMLELFPRLRDRINPRAGTLSGREQAMVALARALIGKPKLVIMDEPSFGLSPRLIDEYFVTVAEVNRRGTTAVLIEQNAETALSIAHRGIMLVKGRSSPRARPPSSWAATRCAASISDPAPT